MRGIWWTAIFAGIMIVITVLSINLLGDELKTRLAPKQRDEDGTVNHEKKK